ncbi:MAG TPA: putative baseplate assembly protein [Bryobacteraceae bacterium]|nr:putative baseplate assembly protein [Bryobacteraceae bacterium]
MSQTPLCQLPPTPAAVCGCNAAPAPPAVPAIPNNAPGLATIAYRIGTFTSFRQAMLDEVPDPALLGTAPNPFLNWRPGADGDYHTLFIEFWAYLADILTFYQERIANEAYLGTASQRDSALRLVELIAYRPGPGAAASGVASFAVAPGKVITIPAGFRIGSKPAPGQTPAVFETSAAITARAEHNAIAMSAVAPVNQFAQLTNIQYIYAGIGSIGLLEAANDIFGASLASTYESTLSVLGLGSIQTESAVFESSASAPLAEEAVATPRMLMRSAAPLAGARAPASSTASFSTGFSFGSVGFLGDLTFQRWPFYGVTTRTVVLAGTNHRLNVGDYVLTLENGKTGTLFQLSSVATDKTASTTTVTWSEPAGKTYDTSSSPVALFALRVKASPFGSDAPPWNSLAPSLTGTAPATSPPSWPSPPPFQTNWDDATKSLYYMPAGSTIDLDGVYDAARGTTQNPGWVVLLAGGADPSTAQTFQFIEARTGSVTGFTLTKKVTRLTLTGSSVPGSEFPIRDTMVLTGSEQLPLQNDLPLPDLLRGDTLILAGLYPNLQQGLPVMVQGNLYNANGEPADLTAEYHTIKSQPVQDTTNSLTTVVLDKPLTDQYSRSSTSLLANLAAFTQGETVKDEVLGNGNGAANQSFALKKNPLTYLPSTDPASESPVQSTLTIQVNGVAWNEADNLLEADSQAQEYTLTEDSSGVTTVVFGDGVHGAPPPTGVSNVHARYRVGLGTSGNVASGGIKQLLDSIPGIQQVTNPQSSAGGADAESTDRIAVNAPASVRVFNRAVSTEDYAALALLFPGIAKASASWIASGGVQPYLQLTVATAGQTPITATPLCGQLRDFLDQRRDINIPLRIASFTPVYVTVALTVDILDQYPRQATLNAVQAALNPGDNPDGSAGFFAFDRLGFGESLHLSELYAVVQAVPGVSDTNVTQFSVTGAAAPIAPDILIGPTQIAIITNDPTQPQNGLLTITPGTGGFADS